MAASLAECFLAHLGGAGVAPRLAAALEDALARQLAQAAAAWPELTLAPDPVLALWAERVRGVGDDELVAAVEALRAADLYVACACGRGDPVALRGFEARYLAALGAVLVRVTTSPAEVAEVAQVLREKLLVAAPGARPRIVDMAGHGDLAGLIRVAAIRTALNLRRADQRLTALDDHGELAVLAPDGDPELTAIRGQHRALIKGALEQAVLALEPRDRSVLRMHLLEGLTIDDIGRAHDVHRATAARWLEHVRSKLRTETLKRLRAELGADGDALESLVRVIDSRLQVSFHRLLAATAAP